MPRQPSQTVLDVVTYIQRKLDPTLAYRFACRVGMCGSCAMTVNGVPRWTCRTHVDKVLERNTITVAPLRNLPVIRDLVVDMREFFDKWARAKGEFRGGLSRQDEFEPVRPDSPPRREADAGIECIGCAVCYAACDVVKWNPDYLGPAALNRAWTLLNDVREKDNLQRLRADLLSNSFLFLGYSFNDTNIRYIWYRMHQLRHQGQAAARRPPARRCFFATFGVGPIQPDLLDQWNIDMIQLDPADKEASVADLLQRIR